MDLERLVHRQPVMSCYFAGESLSAEKLRDTLEPMFREETVGLALRPLVEGKSAKATLTHDAAFDREGWIGRLRELALSRGWSYLLLPGFAEIPDFQVLFVLEEEGSPISSRIGGLLPESLRLVCEESASSADLDALAARERCQREEILVLDGNGSGANVEGATTILYPAKKDAKSLAAIHKERLEDLAALLAAGTDCKLSK